MVFTLVFVRRFGYWAVIWTEPVIWICMVIPLIVTAAGNPVLFGKQNRSFLWSCWIWFLGMAVFYGVLFLWFLNQVKKPDYKKNYVLVKTLQSAAFVSVFLAAAVVSRDILDFWLMLPAFVC